MPTPIFNNVVMTAANDPFTPVVAYTSNRSESNAVDGNVKSYANGRRRAVQQAGVNHQFIFTLRDVSDLPITLSAPGSGIIVPFELIQVEWVGVRVVVRDHRGRYFEGIYFTAGITDRKTPHLYDIALTVTELTPEAP